MDKNESPVSLSPVIEEFLANVDLNVEVIKGQMLNSLRAKEPESFDKLSHDMSQISEFIKMIYLQSFRTFLLMLNKKAHEQEEKTK